MLEFVRQDSGQLFGAAGLFQQAAQESPPGRRERQRQMAGLSTTESVIRYGESGCVAANVCTTWSIFRSRSGSRHCCVSGADVRQSAGQEILPMIGTGGRGC